MKVLLLTLSFGSGHVQAARTVAREIKRQAPDAEVRVLDALTDCRFLFRAFYVWPYWAMVCYAPALWGRFFTRRTQRMKQSTAMAIGRRHSVNLRCVSARNQYFIIAAWLSAKVTKTLMEYITTRASTEPRV